MWISFVSRQRFSTKDSEASRDGGESKVNQHVERPGRIFRDVKLNWKFNMLREANINSAISPRLCHSFIAASQFYLIDNPSSTTPRQHVAQRSSWRCHVRHSRLSLFTPCQPEDNLQQPQGKSSGIKLIASLTSFF